jgi:hypothetical protein
MKGTKTFVKPAQAEKRVNGVKTEWECPSCNTDAVFCKGKIVPPYFRHPPESNCTFFNPTGPTGMSAQHLGAQNLLKNLLESDRALIVTRRCTRCRKDDPVYGLGARPPKSSAATEHGFYIDGTRYSADVALLEDNQIRCIFEVCWTHETNRPPHEHPWVELRAEDILEIGAEGPVILNCILPSHKCAVCVVEEERLEKDRKVAAEKQKRDKEELQAKRKKELHELEAKQKKEKDELEAKQKKEEEELEAKQKKREEEYIIERENCMKIAANTEALGYFCEKDDIEQLSRIIKENPTLLNRGIERRGTLLQVACVSGKKKIVEWLLDQEGILICERSLNLSAHLPEISALLKRAKARSRKP